MLISQPLPIRKQVFSERDECCELEMNLKSSIVLCDIICQIYLNTAGRKKNKIKSRLATGVYLAPLSAIHCLLTANTKVCMVGIPFQ